MIAELTFRNSDIQIRHTATEVDLWADIVGIKGSRPSVGPRPSGRIGPVNFVRHSWDDLRTDESTMVEGTPASACVVLSVATRQPQETCTLQ